MYVDAFRWFPKATELEELRLDLQGRINLQSTIENKIRLTSIKRLTLKRCKIHGGKTVLSLLKTMRCREELIWIDNKLKETFETGSRVELSRLHTLKISSGDRFDFWSYLQAHCLTDLHVQNCIAFDSLPSMFRMFARNRKNIHMDNCSNEFMINTINAIPDVEKLTLRMPAADSPTKVLRHLSRDKNPDKLPLLKELRIRIINGFSPLVKNVLVEEVLKSRSSGLDKSVEGSPSSDLDESFEASPGPTALLSYVKLSMEVPQSYYEEYTSPDTKLCMDEIKALASQSSMEIDFDIRVAEIGEYITEVEEERVMSEKIKIRNVSDDGDDGIWW
ncbi:hypothetical protein BDQ17DRAFT_1431179 [Cyathus striatus]|nr:hypothetical protein BDQ17DRAFT_1431179 [Cyathus striatus]